MTKPRTGPARSRTPQHGADVASRRQQRRDKRLAAGARKFNERSQRDQHIAEFVRIVPDWRGKRAITIHAAEKILACIPATREIEAKLANLVRLTRRIARIVARKDRGCDGRIETADENAASRGTERREQ